MATPDYPPPAQNRASGIVRGALIACEDGDVAIESIKIGDIINTLSDGPQVVRWVGNEMATSAVICFKAGSLGESSPSQDLLVAAAQRMVIAGWQAEVLFGEPEVLVAAKDLLNSGTISLANAQTEIEIFRILFDKHETIKANGAPSESFYPSQSALNALSPKTYAELKAEVPEINKLDPHHPFALARLAISSAEAALLR